MLISSSFLVEYKYTPKAIKSPRVTTISNLPIRIVRIYPLYFKVVDKSGPPPFGHPTFQSLSKS
jgi:hypothetical protein